MPTSTIAPRIAAAVLACLTSFGCGKDAKPDATAEGAEAGEQTPEPPPLPPLTQEQLAELYRNAKDRYEAVATMPEGAAIELDLQRVANEAEDAHLRANASLMLGAIAEARNDQRTAISFYRQAVELIPEDADTHIVLALALAKAQRWDEAIVEQWKVVEAIPDDLLGWLVLGEMHVKGRKLDEAAKVYGAYELRRKGLLDGLTLKQDGEYLQGEAERAACAQALAPAVDNGTALGLLYALDSDPSPLVRTAVVSVMGEQRLLGYQKLLKDKLASEADAEVKEAIEWALSEIERDGVETAPGVVPESLAKQVEAEAAALAAAEKKQAEKGDEPAEGEGDKPEGEAPVKPPESD